MKNYLSKEALSEPCLRNFLLAPIMGFLFVMFLPVIGYILVIAALAKWAAKRASLIFAPAPMAAGEAYLTGHPNGVNVPTVSNTTDQLSEIAAEIKRRKEIDS